MNKMREKKNLLNGVFAFNHFIVSFLLFFSPFISLFRISCLRLNYQRNSSVLAFAKWNETMKNINFINVHLRFRICKSFFSKMKKKPLAYVVAFTRKKITIPRTKPQSHSFKSFLKDT